MWPAHLKGRACIYAAPGRPPSRAPAPAAARGTHAALPYSCPAPCSEAAALRRLPYCQALTSCTSARIPVSITKSKMKPEAAATSRAADARITSCGQITGEDKLMPSARRCSTLTQVNPHYKHRRKICKGSHTGNRHTLQQRRARRPAAGCAHPPLHAECWLPSGGASAWPQWRPCAPASWARPPAPLTAWPLPPAPIQTSVRIGALAACARTYNLSRM